MCASWKTACPSLIRFPVKAKHMLCRLNPRIQRLFFIFKGLNFSPCSLISASLSLVFAPAHVHVCLLFVSFTQKQELSLAAVFSQLVWKGQLWIYGQPKRATFIIHFHQIHSDRWAVLCQKCFVIVVPYALLLFVFNNNGVFNEKDCMQKCWFPLWIKNSMHFFKPLLVKLQQINKVLFSNNET